LSIACTLSTLAHFEIGPATQKRPTLDTGNGSENEKKATEVAF
jgi:hypothetical protein